MLTDLFEPQPFQRPAPDAPSEPATKPIDSCDAFGWLTNERDRAVMLQIRHATGDITALAYPLLETAKFNPSTGITLNFSGTTVTITGTNLNTEVRPGVRLFDGLTRHRVAWVTEAVEAMEGANAFDDERIDQIQISP